MNYQLFTAPALRGGGIIRETLLYGTLGGVLGVLIAMVFA
jgi:hypothetical protein